MWRNAVDRSGLPGKFKAWIFQPVILSRISGNLWCMICQCQQSRSVSDVTLDGSGNKLRLLGRGVQGVEQRGLKQGENRNKIAGIRRDPEGWGCTVIFSTLHMNTSKQKSHRRSKSYWYEETRSLDEISPEQTCEVLSPIEIRTDQKALLSLY